MKSQKKYQPMFSLEFFPPKTDADAARLGGVLDILLPLEPAYVSITYGAGGSTQERTLETVLEIRKAREIDVAPHLTCIGSTVKGIRELIDTYVENGIRRIVALRGDLPVGMGDAGEFRFANELVSFIRSETGEHFYIEVAAYPEFHPQAPDAATDLKNFKRKVDAGADSAITQYFYNLDAYLRFVESCEKMGVDIPIVPGIMPITNYAQLMRFSAMCGAEIPRWLRWRLDAYGDDHESLRSFGLDVTVDLCRRLLEEGAPGLHIYTLNQAEAALFIWESLGLSSRFRTPCP